MPAPLVPYEFTEDDAVKMAAMGYVFIGVDKKNLPVFINKNFKGFNLATLLEEVEKLMIISAGSLPIVSRYVEVNGGELIVGFTNDHGGDQDAALIFERKFYREKLVLTVEHCYLVVPKPWRGKRLSKLVLKLCLDCYLDIAVQIVKVTAGLSGGPYAWARAGFVAVNYREVGEIFAKAKAQLTAQEFMLVESVYNDYYKANPGGTAFPMRTWGYIPAMKNVLLNAEDPCQWDGRLDLTNPVDLRNFKSYVNR